MGEPRTHPALESEPLGPPLPRSESVGLRLRGFDPTDPFRSGFTLPDLWFA